MPIIKIGDGYIYKNNKKGTKKNIPRALSVLLVFMMMIFSVALSFFTYTKFDVASALKLNRYMVFKEVSYYVVSLYSGDTYESVSQNLSSLKSQDGAGYVLKSNSIYYLIASVYNLRESAEKVVNSLQNFDAEVVNIKFESLVLSSDFSTDQISAIKYALGLVNRSFDKLYDLTISFDRGEMLEAEVKQKLQIYKESCQSDKESYAKVFENCCENIVTNIKIYQNEVIANLSALILSQNFSSDIKYINISDLVSFSNLQNAVKK